MQAIPYAPASVIFFSLRRGTISGLITFIPSGREVSVVGTLKPNKLPFQNYWKSGKPFSAVNPRCRSCESLSVQEPFYLKSHGTIED